VLKKVVPQTASSAEIIKRYLPYWNGRSGREGLVGSVRWQPPPTLTNTTSSARKCHTISERGVRVASDGTSDIVLGMIIAWQG
jgi:hypothetical protein